MPTKIELETTPTANLPSRKRRVLFWVIQGVLAALFLFAGGMKLALPAAELTKQGPLPEAFLRFIGMAEVLGALGLILPGILRIRPGLTPLAAAGLALIMSGATVLTLAMGQAAAAVIPLVVGLLAAYVVHGRWQRSSSRQGGPSRAADHGLNRSKPLRRGTSPAQSFWPVAPAVGGVSSRRSRSRTRALAPRAAVRAVRSRRSRTRALATRPGPVARLLTTVSSMYGGAIPTTHRRSTTRPGNLSRAVAQPASLRCALTPARRTRGASRAAPESNRSDALWPGC